MSVHKVLLIVGLVILLVACTQPEPAATPTPAVDLQATIEALRAEPTPMVVVIATATPTATPTNTPTPTPTPTATPISGLQQYAKTCGTVTELLMDSDTWGDVTQNAQFAYQTMESLTPPEGLEIYHDSLLDRFAATVAVAEQQSPNKTLEEEQTKASDPQSVTNLVSSAARLSAVTDTLASNTRDTLVSSGCLY